MTKMPRALIVCFALLAAACAGGIDENTQPLPSNDAGYAVPDAGTQRSCNANNCSGCCQENTCLPGNSDYLCGSSASACFDCAASGTTCGPDGTCAAPCEANCSGKCPGASDGCGGVCTANDCPGCCDGEVCKSGGDANACGVGGAFCQDCTAASGSCNAGRCENTTKCTTQSCPNGCCDGDVCRSGLANNLCGAGGQACSQCASDQVCKSGSCEAKVQCQPKCQGKCSGASDGCGGTCLVNDCNGCCHGTSCFSGSTTYNCGGAGGICQRCGADETCASGVCTKKCTPSCSGKCAGAADGCGGVCATNSCAGCCAGTACYSGVTVYNCGSSGGACDRCASGQTCSGGSCIQSCTPSCAGRCTGASDGCGGVCTANGCSGCCHNKVCFSGTSTAYCGKSGASCQSCDSYEYCSSTTACTVSTVAKWDLEIKSASLSTSKSWDDYTTTSRLPDVRIRLPNLSISGAAVQTITKWNDYTPQWNSTFGPFYTYQLAKAHIVEIIDYDSPTSSDVIGRCTLTISKSTLAIGSKTLFTCKSPGDGKDYLLWLKLAFSPR